MLLVTFDAVEYNGGSPTQSPSTFQFQVDLATGTVRMVWLSFSGSSSTSDALVGCTLAGTGLTPVSTALATANPVVLQPDSAPMVPMTLSASPAPVINPSTTVTYTLSGIQENSPGSNLYIAGLFFSLSPFPAGFDILNVGLTTVPGCNVYLGTLDASIGGANTVPTISWSLDFSAPGFTPGLVIAAQAVSLFNGAFPLANGEAGGYLLSNAVNSVTWPQ